MAQYSDSPSGEKFLLPQKEAYAAEYARIEGLVKQARSEGKEIVVVMGVGFVGAVMAAIIADTVDKKTGKPGKFVIGCQRPSTAQLLEDTDAQPGRVAGKGRRPGS